MNLGDRDSLYLSLQHRGLGQWVPELQEHCERAFQADSHGKMPEWIKAWQGLPAGSQAYLTANEKAVTVRSDCLPSSVPEIRQRLMELHPWRKGPFHFLGWDIDTEWRSDWKWNRLAKHVDFQNCWVLDVGCGNGYYGWRMMDAGAGLVLGCDPFQLYLMQFEVFRKYADQQRHYVVPLMDTQLPESTQAFDVSLSMGVLYHRTSPIDHLKTMWGTLRPNGTLVLETLVLEEPTGHELFDVLVPEDRYAQMKNVWFIPTVTMLKRWLNRCRFKDIEVVDVSRTTMQEQRTTDWMTFQSLADFLNPKDASQSIEGYQAPTRVLMTAKRKA